MDEASFPTEVLILLIAGVAIVALVQRMRISPVLGYLIAGIVIGPHAFGLVSLDSLVEKLAHFGVVFLLFTVGLELPVRRLMLMWRFTLALGPLQVLICSAAIAAAGMAFGLAPEEAIVVGGALSLSSTAVVLRVLSDRNELAARHGRAALGVLLAQDLAVVPLLVLIPLLGGDGASLLRALGIAFLQAVAAVAAIYALGRFVLRPALRQLAFMRNAELFVAAALLIVLGTAALTDAAGLSMELGAFLAGMLLADSEYRHQVEADIAPFRAILLGLFFVTVGMQLDLALLREAAPAILALIAIVAILKAAVVLGLGRLFGLTWMDAGRTGILLGPGGEFAFVLLGVATSAGLLAWPTAQPLMVAVALGMLAIPPLAALAGLLAGRTAPRATELAPLREASEEIENHFVIAGFGRVGRTVARILSTHDIPWFAVDRDAERVDGARKAGLPVFFGDAGRREVLIAAGIERAKAAVLTLDNPDRAHAAVSLLRTCAPQLRIMVRAHDHAHGDRLGEAGAHTVILETTESSLQLAAAGLRENGVPAEDVDRVIDRFRHDSYSELRDIPVPRAH
ncbi:MAG: monovalent cation:proton antiporter-2 (CPA2) family protein [Alphaproteobacteria bacterium]